jgi:cysteine desulfurase/selenocysteine lyase
MKRKTQFHYLDHASMGRPTRRTLEHLHTALSDLGTFASTGTLETIRQFEAVDRARARVAKFIHADPSNILLVGNTTEALGTIATALPMSRGDNILMADIEFMGATVAWRGACQRAGVEIVPVKTAAGKVFAEQFAARANSRTRAILISSVQEISGWRSDFRAISDVAAKFGAFVIADGIQETGARPVDFQRLGVDAFCAGGHKWLRSPFGLGFACIGPRLLDVLMPAYQGYLALAEPAVGWDRYMELAERTPFDLPADRTDAGRLETGGYPNWLGAMGLDAAIEDFQKLGPERSWSRIKKLRSRLVAGLRELGIGFLGGPEPREDAFAGMLTFCLPGGAAEEKKLLEEMKKARVFASLRYVSGIGGIRTAVHESNTDADVDALLDVTRRFLKKTARKKR